MTTNLGIYRGYTTGAFRKGSVFFFESEMEIRWFMGTTQIINCDLIEGISLAVMELEHIT